MARQTRRSTKKSLFQVDVNPGSAKQLSDGVAEDCVAMTEEPKSAHTSLREVLLHRHLCHNHSICMGGFGNWGPWPSEGLLELDWCQGLNHWCARSPGCGMRSCQRVKSDFSQLVSRLLQWMQCDLMDGCRQLFLQLARWAQPRPCVRFYRWQVNSKCLFRFPFGKK